MLWVAFNTQFITYWTLLCNVIMIWQSIKLSNKCEVWVPQLLSNTNFYCIHQRPLRFGLSFNLTKRIWATIRKKKSDKFEIQQLPLLDTEWKCWWKKEELVLFGATLAALWQNQHLPEQKWLFEKNSFVFFHLLSFVAVFEWIPDH